MKLKLFILFIVFAFSKLVAQQAPQFSQYIFNYYAINPAMAGSQGCLNFSIGHRNQWLNLEGAPKTSFGSFSTELKLKQRPTNRSKHGIGMYLENDVIGPTAKTSVNLAYAFHLPITREINASFGVFVGLHQFKLDASKIELADANDPLIGGSSNTLLVPDFSPGLFLSHKNWFAGYSIKQLARNKWKIIGTNDSRNRWHHYLVGGKRFDIGRINLIPSAMLKYAALSKAALDLNLIAELNRSFDVGIGWRNQDQIGAMVKIKFARFFTLGYSYDYTISNLRFASSNTHEVIIVVSACPHNRGEVYQCPIFN